MTLQTCTQNWPAYNQAQQVEKALFMELLADLCSELQEPDYTFGRPKNSLRDMVYCAAFKVYSMYSGRRFTSDMKQAQEEGHIKKAPHYNSIFNYLERKELTPILNDLIVKTSLPLACVEVDFAVDSSGFTTSTYDRWFDYKYSGEGKYVRHKEWVKAHLMCGVKTNIVTAVRLTDGTANDSPEFIHLVNRTAKNFCIQEVSADKAYSSRENLKCVDWMGAVPYIPFKKDAIGNPKGYPIWRRMYNYFQLHSGEFYKHYHKRSNVESTFFMIKSKFGSNLKSKTRTAQYNEVLCKILCHNICVVIQELHEMGISFPLDSGRIFTLPVINNEGV